ncbi:MAG: hypothetical protein P8I02_06075, partial [Flavobacteriales bacterium]|nr:hypothetical protein [Flavobacteriales bacterium]
LTPDINGSLVTLKGNIIDTAEDGFDEVGHCYKVEDESSPTINDFIILNPSVPSKGEFRNHPKGLSYNTNYTTRVFARKDSEIIYGDIFNFTIQETNVYFEQETAQFLTQFSLNYSSEIMNLGSLLAIEYGHCWNYNGQPSISDSKSSYFNLQSDTIYNSYLTNLLQNQTLYIRPYAKFQSLDNSINTIIIYGEEFSKLITTPSVSTNNHFFNFNTAILVGSVSSLGVLEIIDHGHCWSTSFSDPNINNSNFTNLGSIDSETDFNSSISLIPGNIYYYRSYLIDISGAVFYGQVKIFNF